MKKHYGLFLLACMVLLGNTAKAQDYIPVDVEINGVTINICSLTLMEEMECTTPSPACRVYQLNWSHGIETPRYPTEELVFTFLEKGDAPNHWFHFWNAEAERWEMAFSTDPGITFTRSATPAGTVYSIANTDPDPGYFTSGAPGPVLLTNRFNLRVVDVFEWTTLFPIGVEVIEIWSPAIH